MLLAGGVLTLLVGRLRDAARPHRAASISACAFAAGLSLILGAGGGLYWLVPAMVLGFGGAVLNAWVLLVEIVR